MDFVWAYSNRTDGNMSLCYGDTREALNNRRKFLGNLGVNYRDLVCAKQVHGGRVRYVTQKDLGKGSLGYGDSIADTDAFITDKKNIPLAIFTADCLAVFLYDPRRPAIGLIHAGWRSTKENIIKNSIRLMQERFASQPCALRAHFGPAIRSCCYEVAQEFADSFGRAVIKREDRYYIDLAAVNRGELLDSGVKEENISDPKICTSCRNKEFFSFRKEGDACGRMMAVAIVK